MSRHYRSTPKDKVINSFLSFVFLLKLSAYWVDMRLARVLTYLRTASCGTIITDFLATATVAGILIFPIVCGIFWLHFTAHLI